MFKYRQPCNWDNKSILMTILIFIVWGTLPFIQQHDSFQNYTLNLVGILIFILVICGIYYCPKYIEATNSLLIIGKLISKKVLPLADIASVTPYQHTMNFGAPLGSSGFMGYWGHYRNQELGKFSVYGTSLDQLILVILKSGKQYVISCKNAEEMSNQINLRLSKRTGS